jgi:hypothetical protein
MVVVGMCLEELKKSGFPWTFLYASVFPYGEHVFIHARLLGCSNPKSLDIKSATVLSDVSSSSGCR